MSFWRLLLAVAAIALFNSRNAQAVPYTGSAPVCSSLSTATCRIDFVDFLKTKYSYLGNSLNYDNSSDATANSFRAAAGQRVYVPGTDTWNVSSGGTSPFGFAKHPTISNVLIRVGTSISASKSLDYWIWGAGDVNAVHNLSEISFQDSANSWFKVFSAANTPQYQDVWQNRGLYWADYQFDVTPAGGGVWTGTPRNTPVHGFLDFNYANVLQHDRWEMYTPNAATAPGQGMQRVSTYTFYANLSDPQIINKFGGSLPTPMEALKVTHTIKDSGGTTTQWETYYYGRQRLPDGSYNYFGLIYFEDGDWDTSVCLNGVPTASHPNALCDSATNTYIHEQSSYSTFVPASPASFYSQALGAPYRNDIKFTRRSSSDSYGNVEEHAFRTQSRGGFKPQGNGNDSTNTLVTSSDWVYLETDGASEDVYMYVSGQDPIRQPTPVNYCRDGYSYVGSMVTQQSYNVLNYGGGTRGDFAASAVGKIGAVYPPPGIGPSPHWIVFCSATNSVGPAMYVNASNSGEASCTAGYVTRLWFGTNHSGVTACPSGGSCFDGSAKNYINMCVRADQCVGNCMGTNNP